MDLSKLTAPYSPVALVREFFGAPLQEMKSLPAEDRTQLASAIARQFAIPAEKLNFAPVEY